MGKEAKRDTQQASSYPHVSAESPLSDKRRNSLQSQIKSTSVDVDYPSLDVKEYSDFYCPGDQVGIIIGREGKNKANVEAETNTQIKIDKRINNIAEKCPD